MKSNHLFLKDLVRRVALFHIFAKFLNVWFNRRQLDSHICSSIQSMVTSYVLQLLENSTRHLGNNERKKEK